MNSSNNQNPVIVPPQGNTQQGQGAMGYSFSAEEVRNQFFDIIMKLNFFKTAYFIYLVLK